MLKCERSVAAVKAAAELVILVTSKNIAIDKLAILGSTTVFRIRIAGAVQPLANRIWSKVPESD